jgi:phosphatidylinositol alpha-1,6-mannosyltransferase
MSPPALLLAYDFPPTRGGIARVMSEMARRHPAGSLVVSTGSSADDGDGLDGAFPNRIDRLPLAPRHLRVVPGLLLWARRAASLARETEAGFVWCGHLKPAAYAAKWTHERVGTPYGVIVYGGDLLALQHQIHQSPAKRKAAALLLRSAAVVVAVSGWTRDLCLALMSELGVDAEQHPVRVVPLGADPAEFRPGIDTTAVRKRYGLGPGRWLLTVGGLAPYKGSDTVLHALASLRDAVPDLHYALAGAGAQAGVLQAQADALGIGDRVRFLPEVPDADLPALYNAADVYVGVSRREGTSVEGFGVALAEASACAKAVVAGRSGGIPELVHDGETGLLVDPESVEPVAAALARLLVDPALARRLGTAARASVERYYNWDRVIADLRGIAAEFGARPVLRGDG